VLVDCGGGGGGGGEIIALPGVEVQVEVGGGGIV